MTSQPECSSDDDSGVKYQSMKEMKRKVITVEDVDKRGARE